jgi:hypothetical protein
MIIIINFDFDFWCDCFELSLDLKHHAASRYYRYDDTDVMTVSPNGVAIAWFRSFWRVFEFDAISS